MQQSPEKTSFYCRFDLAVFDCQAKARDPIEAMNVNLLVSN